MSDYMQIENFFGKETRLPKYSKKRWIKIHPDNNDYTANNGLTAGIRYNMKTAFDKLIDYSDGFIFVTATISRAALAAKDAAPKGSFSFVNQAFLTMNGGEIDSTRFNYITTSMLNMLEYSNDHARVAEQYCYAKDSSGDHANNAGHTTRKAMIPDAANNEIQLTFKLPLAYVSTFFRALDFPLINQVFELNITYRTNQAVLREAGAAVDVGITSTVLYLPVVELPRDYDAKFLKELGSGSMKRSLVWNRLHYPVNEAGVNGAQDRIVEASAVGLRKIYCIAIPTARWNSQEHIESTSDTSITGINITIDSEDFYPQSIQNDIEAYELLAENFNMGGKDKNTGTLLNYADWLSVHRYYVFDVSRQKVFESDPRKDQSIRFRGTVSANSRLLIFTAKEKTTTFDFANPSKSTTV